MILVSFDEAKKFRDKFRPNLPVTYNAGILSNQPIPQVPHFSFDETNNNVQIEDNEEKFVLPSVQLDNIDFLAIEGIINANTETIGLHHTNKHGCETDVNSELVSNIGTDEIIEAQNDDPLDLDAGCENCYQNNDDHNTEEFQYVPSEPNVDEAVGGADAVPCGKYLTDCLADYVNLYENQLILVDL